MLVFWTMERSLPSGRRPGPAGRPQRMREAVGTENSVASTRSSHLARPSVALFLRSLPPPALSSAAAASSAPEGSASPPAPSAPTRPSLPPPVAAPPLAAPPLALHRQWEGGCRDARLSRRAQVSDWPRVRVATPGDFRNLAKGLGGGGGAVYQWMPSADGTGARISMAGTAPRFRPKPLFLAGLPIPFQAGPPELPSPCDPGTQL